MADYTTSVTPDDISGMFSGQNSDAQRLQPMMQKISQEMKRITDLMEKRRDLSKDEADDLGKTYASILKISDLYKRMNAERVRGMNDYSVAILAAEDRLKKTHDLEKANIAEVNKLRVQASRFEEISQIKKKGERNNAFKEYFSDTNLTSKQIQAKRNDERGRLSSSIDSLESNRKGYKEDAKSLQAVVSNQDILKKLSVRLEDKSSPIVEQMSGERKRYRGSGLDTAFEVAGDMHVPLVSHAATLAKYGARGANYGASLMGGAEEGGGMSSMMGAIGGIGGLGMGLMGGGAVLAGGYGMMQAYKAYNMSHALGGTGRRLAGQMGTENAMGARQDAIQAYAGYGGAENLDFLSNQNRTLGSKAGTGSLKSLTGTAAAFGQSRDELLGQAGGLVNSGAASPQSAAQTLKDIMSEGVKGGMDRARITEFTSQVLSLQEQVFKTTGGDSSKQTAKSLSEMLKAYTGNGSAFMRGPEMSAMGSMNQGIMGSAKNLESNPTVLRAFSNSVTGSSSVRPGDELFKTQLEMEKGLFGGDKDSPKGMQKAEERLAMIIGQFKKEAGGNDNLAMRNASGSFGTTITQMKKLFELNDRMGKSGGGSKADIDVMKELVSQQKDPLLALQDINKRMDANIAKLALDSSALTIMKTIDEKLLSLQTSALGFLTDIAHALAPQGDYQKNLTLPKKVTDYLSEGGKGFNPEKNIQNGILDTAKDGLKSMFGMGDVAPPQVAPPTKSNLPTGTGTIDLSGIKADLSAASDKYSQAAAAMLDAANYSKESQRNQAKGPVRGSTR